MTLRVLAVDADPARAALVEKGLSPLRAQVSLVRSVKDARARARTGRLDLVFLSITLPDAEPLALLSELLSDHKEAAVVVTGDASVEHAVEAMKRGARDYLAWPFTAEAVQRVAEQAAERRVLLHTVRNLEGQLAAATPDVELESRAPEMRAALETIARAASSDVSVLLRGESGTGKGVLARRLHAQSPRAARRFVVVNCPTLSPELLASEMFGHVRGAFTGAVRDQVGRVEAADGGTLFLDEVGELSPALQAKLLRFLQDHEFERIGENHTRTADVRVVAATNRDLEAEMRAGRFREDLLYRLNVVEIVMPPLRFRPDDILPLAREFVAFFARSVRRAPPRLSEAAEQVLLKHAWPGNVRELRNAIEHAVMLWPDEVIEPHAFPERIAGNAQASPGARVGGEVTLEVLEREHVAAVLARKPTLEDAAETLGIDPSTLWRKRRKYKL